MTFRKFIAIFVSFVIMLAACSCAANESDLGNTTTQASQNADTTPTTEAAPPEEDPIPTLYYDDRIAVSELLGREVSVVEIKDQQVTSKQVGSDNSDENVLVYESEKGRIIATGVGSATVVADGEEIEIKVDPAPISLIAIIGHSLGMGSKGVSMDSVLCEDGQVYTTYLGGSMNSSGAFSTVMSDDLSTLKGNNVGLGYTNEKRPYAIDFLTSEGIGRTGSDAGIAYTWNKLTGEKVWVVNAAVGGSSVVQWISGSYIHTLAVEIFNDAANVLKNEVAAGHYVFKDYAMLNFSSSNFGYQSVINDDAILHRCNTSMWDGFKEKCNVDINGDGKADPPTSLGYIPMWYPTSLDYNWDKDIITYMASSTEYPDVYVASRHTSIWSSDTKVKSSFPKVDYQTHRGETLTKPTTYKEVMAADNVHYSQVAYNALGQLIGENMYDYHRTDNVPTKISFEDYRMKRVSSVTIKVGESKPLLIVPDNTVGSNFDITVSGNIEYGEYGVLKGISAGEGKITVSCGDKVLGELKVTVK